MMSPPKTLDKKSAELLLDALKNNGGTHKQVRRGIRNYTMALLMLDAGLRVGELVQLLTTDLLFSGQPVNTIVVRPNIAKNKRERLIPTSSRLKDAIKEIAAGLWPTEASHFPYFAIYQLDSRISISTRQVERTIRRASLDVLGRPVYPHVLRHTFASRLMKVTNARVVQQLLGHNRLTSTQIYCHPDAEDLTDAINQVERRDISSSPLENNPPSPGELPNGLDAEDADRDVT